MALFKAGVIGCGGRGRGHAEGYQASPDVEIVACADPFEEARENFAEQFGVARTYEDYREMLDKESLDFVKRWLSQPRIVGLKLSTPRNRWHRHGAMPKHSIKRVWTTT
ncbi:Gfo/Idh/MocA family oxidoreductase [Candidatus Poribacteria bacterium]|nr:Gfo/Idh/MocA family oxidoreductase [Candidatus Poribacteria bacterium]